MQLKATLLVIATVALGVLANPVPGTTAVESADGTAAAFGVCTCLCDPCTGKCKLCDSGWK